MGACVPACVSEILLGEGGCLMTNLCILISCALMAVVFILSIKCRSLGLIEKGRSQTPLLLVLSSFLFFFLFFLSVALRPHFYCYYRHYYYSFNFFIIILFVLLLLNVAACLAYKPRHDNEGKELVNSEQIRLTIIKTARLPW